MKKVFSLVLCLIMLSLVLSSCGNDNTNELLKGEASKIVLIDGTEYTKSKFEYINKDTVLITSYYGVQFYVPTTSIVRIRL